jgi:hypothetical protein
LEHPPLWRWAHRSNELIIASFLANFGELTFHALR